MCADTAPRLAFTCDHGIVNTTLQQTYECMTCGTQMVFVKDEKGSRFITLEMYHDMMRRNVAMKSGLNPGSW